MSHWYCYLRKVKGAAGEQPRSKLDARSPSRLRKNKVNYWGLGEQR